MCFNLIVSSFICWVHMGPFSVGGEKILILFSFILYILAPWIPHILDLCFNVLMFSLQIPSLYLFIRGDFYYLTDFLLFVAHCFLIPDNKCFLTFVVFDCKLPFKASCSSLFMKIRLLFFLYFCCSFSFSISLPSLPPSLTTLPLSSYLQSLFPSFSFFY